MNLRERSARLLSATTGSRWAVSLALVLVLGGCLGPRTTFERTAGSAETSTARGPHHPLRAFIEPADIEKAVEFEEALSRSYDTPPATGEPWFEVRPGRSHVLVVAGHATAQTREGRRKPADGGTGALADALHRLADVTIVANTARSPSDPNYYDDNDFKRELARLLDTGQYTLVLDLHASRSYRPYDVDLGTMNGKALPGQPHIAADLIDAFDVEGLTAFSQDYFAASKNQTVTKFVAARGVPCVQLEISTTCLIAAQNGRVVEGRELQIHRFAQVLQGLVRFIRAWDGAPAATQPVEHAGAE